MTLFCVAGTNVAREPHHVGCVPSDKLKKLDYQPSPGSTRKVEHCDGRRVRLAYPWSCSKDSRHGPATRIASAKYESSTEQKHVCDACLEPTLAAFRSRGALLIEDEPVAEPVCCTCKKPIVKGEPCLAIAVSG